ncbi:MAG: hypothetical protein PHR30_01470 [Gallionellaceae bacterium]|nr:hypothetical protein [Gallionellaceae bacterium]
MAQLPEAAEQLLRMHAPFIHAVVNAVHNRALIPHLLEMLREAESRGWPIMVSCVRQIIDGQRERTLLLGLDEEDKVIVEAILAGIDNPATLPPLGNAGDAQAAAPGLATMIALAGRGNLEAFTTLAKMAEQMMKAGGDMARLGGIMRRLVDGERDEAKLCKGMGELGRKLVRDILAELNQTTLH